MPTIRPQDQDDYNPLFKPETQLETVSLCTSLFLLFVPNVPISVQDRGNSSFH